MREKNLENLRHSTAHLLAAAVTSLWPKALPTIGPVIDNGFYYDFDLQGEKITEEDFPKIEAKMHELVKAWDKIECSHVLIHDYKKKVENNPFKMELIKELKERGEEITVYKSGSFEDLCRGGHIDNPKGVIKYFKLMSVAGAYWHGDEKNKMLTRIYGTAFFSQEELDKYLLQIEEAKARDHREIGKKLNLFVFSDLVGKGLPMLTDKGATIRRELERFVVDEEIKRGYKHVVTPPLAKTDLYKTSGHYPYYKDTMYPLMKVDDEELILRPMTCPHHFMLYKSAMHSYKELPLAYAEMSPQFRYEKSGELSGLTRVRLFCLADAHVFTPKEQAKKVINDVLDLIDFINKTLGFEKGKDYRYRLSLGNRKDEKKYYKDDKAWELAEQILREVLTEAKAPFFEAENEAAFYGPKIDVQMKKVNGTEETAFTVQYDFVMPKRFNLVFTNKEGKEEELVVIHRSSIGALERVMAFLIEHYAGNFPTWLTPVQVKVLPISEKQMEYAQSVVEKLKAENIRVELDERNETLGNKIRSAQNEKVSYMLIVGDKEVETKTVTERARSGKADGPFPIKTFIGYIKKEIDEKTIN